MQAVVETLNSILTGIKERISNPFLGAFGVAWSIVNFRVVLTLFGDGAATEKIRFIENNLIDDNGRLWGWPLLGAVVYLVAVRPLTACFVFLHEWTEGVFASAKNIALKRKRITKEEQERIYAELHEKVAKAEQERAELGKISTDFYRKRNEINSKSQARMLVIMGQLLRYYLREYQGPKVRMPYGSAEMIFGASACELLANEGIPREWLEFLTYWNEFEESHAQGFFMNDDVAAFNLLAMEVFGCISCTWSDDGAKYVVREPNFWHSLYKTAPVQLQA